MSNHFIFEFACYVVGVVVTLAAYGSSLKTAAVATTPTVPTAPIAPAADIELKEFAAVCCPDSPAGLDEVLSFIDELVAPVPTMEDCIVPFTRRRPQVADRLESLGIRQLRAIASELRISKYSRRSKRDLITEIRQRQAA